MAKHALKSGCLLVGGGSLLILAFVAIGAHGRAMQAVVETHHQQQSGEQTMTILEPAATEVPAQQSVHQDETMQQDEPREINGDGSTIELQEDRTSNEEVAPTTAATTTEAQSETATTQHNSQKCQKCCHVIKKVLVPVDESELDHRDYVVSDREFELVLRRLMSENATAASTEPKGSAHEGEHERVGRSIDQSHLDRTRSPARRFLFDPNECFICLDEFPIKPQASDGDNPPPEGELYVEIILFCGHKYHLECISAWYRADRPRSRRCPVCMSLLRHTDGKLFELPE